MAAENTATNEVAPEQSEDTQETRDAAADNPKGHSIEHLAEKAAQTRWFKHTAKAKVAEQCEISTALLDDVNKSSQYRDAVKKAITETSERTPAQILKWIEKWGPEMAVRFGKRMSLDPQVTADLVNEITAEVTPAAEQEIIEANAAKEKIKAEKAAALKAKKEENAKKRAEKKNAKLAAKLAGKEDESGREDVMKGKTSAPRELNRPSS